MSNEQEFSFGTARLEAQLHLIALSVNSGQLSLSFTANLATGPGYSSLTRHSALESCSDLVAGAWNPVPGFADIIGNDQDVNLDTPAAPVSTYFRLKAWLSPD